MVSYIDVVFYRLVIYAKLYNQNYNMSK